MLALSVIKESGAHALPSHHARLITESAILVGQAARAGLFSGASNLPFN